MKVSRIKELIKDLPDDMTVYLDTQESDYSPGLIPIYPSKRRLYFSSTEPLEGYNCWQEWEEIVSDREVDGHRIQIVFTSNIPVYYILVDDNQ